MPTSGPLLAKGWIFCLLGTSRAILCYNPLVRAYGTGQADSQQEPEKYSVRE
jgi:hypothetical protein